MFWIKCYRRWQTVFLSLLCFLSFVGAAVFVFEVEASLLWGYFFNALIGLALVIIAAGLSAMLLRKLKA